MLLRFICVPFVLLSSIPLQGCASWRASGLFPVWGYDEEHCLWIFTCRSLRGHRLSFLLYRFLRVEELSCLLVYIELFKSLPNCFPKCLLHFYIPSSHVWRFQFHQHPHQQLVTGSPLGLLAFWWVSHGRSLWIWLVFPNWVIKMTQSFWVLMVILHLLRTNTDSNLFLPFLFIFFYFLPFLSSTLFSLGRLF